MSSVACQACAAPMSSGSLVCPHCGARQARDADEGEEIDRQLEERRRVREAHEARTAPRKNPSTSSVEKASALLVLHRETREEAWDDSRTGLVRATLFPQ